MSGEMITAESLRRIFSYDAETGVFVRKVTTSSRAQAWMAVGSNDMYGYLTVRIEGRSYKLHRLAWLFVYGCWPEGDIDHMNGNRADNRIANLRDVPRAVNLQNMRAASSHNRSTGVLGVYPAKAGRFCAAISAANKKQHIGTFDTEAEASQAYIAEKRRIHAGCTI